MSLSNPGNRKRLPLSLKVAIESVDLGGIGEGIEG